MIKITVGVELTQDQLNRMLEVGKYASRAKTKEMKEAGSDVVLWASRRLAEMSESVASFRVWNPSSTKNTEDKSPTD